MHGPLTPSLLTVPAALLKAQKKKHEELILRAANTFPPNGLHSQKHKQKLIYDLPTLPGLYIYLLSLYTERISFLPDILRAAACAAVLLVTVHLPLFSRNK